jgi:hypothetical protein
VFRDLVLARVVEPTSILDTGRVLAELGRKAASDKTVRRALARCADRGYRDKIAELRFAHALASGNVSLILYDVTTLYFEAEHEDALRKVGYSKERRVDPQIVVGLLAGRHGFPLEIGCFEGNQAEQSFRMSKTDLAARPMFARKRDAIEAHLTIVFTALAVAREARDRTGLAIRNVIRQLRPLRSATIAVNGAVQAFPPAIYPEQQRILDDLKNGRDLRH